jgi:soluble lytic murein transglycosylase-like protein
MLGTYVGLGVGSIVANKLVINPLSKAIKGFHEGRLKKGKKAKSGSWIRSVGQLGALAALYPALSLQSSIDNYQFDAGRVMEAFSREGTKIEEMIEERELADITPAILESKLPKDFNSRNMVNSNPDSIVGKFERTYRWDKIIDSAEDKYNIESGLLAGLIMRESGGNPLMLNSRDDGGAGLLQIQPGTGRIDLGLKVYGTSKKTGRDRNHGMRLKKLVRENHWNYGVLAEIDERFNVPKSIDAGARYLKKLYDKHGSWDKALSAYNRGPTRPAKKPRKTEHVRMIRLYQNNYLSNDDPNGEVLARLTKESADEGRNLEYNYLRNNSEGKQVFRYEVVEGDNPTLIARDFNRWDKDNGDSSGNIIYSDVVDKNGRYAGSKIKPGQKVYVLAKKN